MISVYANTLKMSFVTVFGQVSDVILSYVLLNLEI